MVHTSAVRFLSAVGVDYTSARAWQVAAAAEVRGAREVSPAPSDAPAEAVAMIEHAPVYTLGARGGRGSVRMPEDALPAPLVDTDRGGDITWHGPGQLVVRATANQDPLGATFAGLVPLYGVDVWEHAYYLKYKNARPDYVREIWKVTDWGKVAALFEEARAKAKAS